MPVTKRRLPSGKVRVSTPGGVKAKATTPTKAAKQERLLNAIEHGFVPMKKDGKGKSAQPGSFLEERQRRFGING